ncbi:hypothetical protein [Hyphomonas jannaschiana]|jgi:Zn-dependent protease|uniref:hypothetical protein n=1 Tax=Hyphomonas jannaschiana TaxID=86 RepID=UPI0035C67C7C
MTDSSAGFLRKPIDMARRHVGGFFRQMLAVLGLMHIVVAIPVGMATPFLPIGLPLAIIGVILLGRNSVWGRRWMEGILTRHPRVERFAPSWLMRLVFGREKRDHLQPQAD